QEISPRACVSLEQRIPPFFTCGPLLCVASKFLHFCCLQERQTMAYKGGKVQKVMVQPINLIFRYLQNRSRIQIWLYEQTNLRIEGHIVGFDEYMNLVLDDAEEYHQKTKARKTLGRILMKGDNITLIQSIEPPEATEVPS
ncbi:unnamed protein product, partial [Owenia fusiformis]